MIKLFDQAKFGTRLRALRESLGLSQQKFSDKCGIRQSTLANAELGNSTPGVDFLLQIWSANPSTSLIWLLTGEGEMTSSAGPAVPSKSSPPVVEDELVKELGELRLIARRGSQAGAWRVMQTIEHAGGSLARSDLLTALGGNPADIDADLSLLRRVRLVSEQNGRWSLTDPGLRTTNPADGAQLVLQAVDILLREVVPAADRRDGSGKIATAELFVPSGAGLDVMQQLLQLVKLHTNELPAGPERVVLVLGAAVTQGDNDA